ncbi:hypothetical protein IQ269_17655 [Tychonema sp. LEGE 07199]|uniref:hypothetical protein n=1 Tax=Microcoleaceae TaxID=1892252 RepID=UPI0018815DAE|nr:MULTISPECIES: hypothetical protein [unclassified Tychonema]MBE9122575.1 hypothetical protein [Tychonema sp. LEGE 07199]MBE9133896.1 hypothetical protein [Tychonema sp. LEGE 07196]
MTPFPPFISPASLSSKSSWICLNNAAWKASAPTPQSVTSKVSFSPYHFMNPRQESRQESNTKFKPHRPLILLKAGLKMHPLDE